MAMVAISTFSLGTGSRTDDFPCASLSFIVIFIASDVRDQSGRVGFLGRRDQMLTLLEDAPRLKASRIMQRREDRSENGCSPGFLTAGCGLVKDGCRRRV
jgi:hypothetical protein